MYLEEYINKAKNGNFLGEKKWLDHSAIIDNISGDIPDTKIEEWKNFRTNSIKNVDWKVLLKNQNSLPALKEEIDETHNSLVFIDGYYSPEFSSLSKEIGINISTLEEYIKENSEFKNLLYTSPYDYAEQRLSGYIDKKPSYFISLNSLLSVGFVIEVEKNKKIPDTINIVHYFSNADSDMLVNPYITIICEEESEACFQETFYNTNSWINNLKEVFIKSKAKLIFSSLQKKTFKGIKTSSFNCHIDDHAELDLKIVNRERNKEDIRVFLNKENSLAKVSGLILSSKNDESDIFCKVIHKGKLTKSDQKWRLISAENSKTSINGKICVNKDAKASDASFYSKSLLLDKKATSFSKPELEILEDEVKCKHGASFGELDSNSLFYLQSRGIKKDEAIILLIYAFIKEIGLNIEYSEGVVVDFINQFFKEINENG